ncbi:MAG: bacteriocin family protein [Candidatus Dormibacteraeota bacterium]|nr:bacteriocin family protein [Candidatus Dormibacteraeota bacterium]MBO0745949.1 bacteriocin family protein [Candidatus Dormibacteraeota bacterium]
MNHLLRERAPITEDGWRLLDAQAKDVLQATLGARKLIDVGEPLGWSHSAHNLGRVTPLAGAPVDGVDAAQRRVLPLVELRARFTVSRTELNDASRGADDLDLDDLDAAARRIASAENAIVLHGWEAAGIDGVTGASSHRAMPLPDALSDLPHGVARAVERLRSAGVDGPYGLALSPEEHTRVVETTEHGGYLLLDHLRRILEGPVVRAPGVRGAVAVSLRGDDYVVALGEDLSLGYLSHDADHVTLYLEETLAFHVAGPEAGIWLPREAQ